MRPDRQKLIRALLDEYITLYAGRDDRLTEKFSHTFSGFTGGGDFLVKDREAWVAITRQDFSQVPNPLRIEMLDVSLQDLSRDVVSATAFFHIHLPINDHILAQETARLLLIFRQEEQGWKIVNSTISIPYHLVEDGEVYPLKNLSEKNRELEELVAERTQALKEANAKLELLSNTDGLTGIANRRSFDQSLATEWKRALRSGLPLCLILLDVDHFKHYNDQYGHLAGDDCLRAIARALAMGGQRTSDMAGRFGGEEFVMLLPITSQCGALEIARRIRNEVMALAIPHEETGAGVVTVSLGVACLTPTRQNSPDLLLREADAALYRAKQSGRNCVRTNFDETPEVLRDWD
ncbi:MAG: diguanylate cyclase [Humidesulfovibrio sp.]|uniref:diguanylate cyclase n=1 Tax=Humidesulfovibrio sp. TaxID=2910988 RepID=UPI0027325E86|nr:diguanylate cyclase [Humidesulfovibrio sp.]MDP2847179.1 diguanylate cyclase [Humidesulfovibrio sp.]